MEEFPISPMGEFQGFRGNCDQRLADLNYWNADFLAVVTLSMAYSS